MQKGFRTCPDDLQFIELLHILENRFYVGTFGNVSAYKSLNMYFIPFFSNFMEV